MKILQINSRFLNTSIHLIKDYIKAKGINLVAISETWGAKNLSQFASLGFSVVSKDRATDNHAGVLILYHHSLKNSSAKRP
jgi:hypothetical protein